MFLIPLLLVQGCERGQVDNPPFTKIFTNRTVYGSSAYPLAVDPSRVGKYPAETLSGAGYFYDEVLEYRVWQHPEEGAPPLNGKGDYYSAFAQYEKAAEFAKTAKGAEKPLVLVRQVEWIDEPEPGKYIPKKGERITEWQVRWLDGSKRTPGSIKDFLAHPRPSREDSNANDSD
jgi:putative acetyltransferase